MKILTYPDAWLALPSAAVVTFDQDLERLVAQMIAAMRGRGGAGIAATQVGDRRSVLVVDPRGGAPTVMVNPALVWASSTENVGVEGCLSLPGVEVVVKRPTACTVTFQDVAGLRVKARYVGWPARVVQHELDHLVGMTFLDRVDLVAARVAIAAAARAVL